MGFVTIIPVVTVAVTIAVTIAVIVIAALGALALRKGVTGLKLILLGINITLLGGITAIDPNTNLGGIEYFIAIIGVALSFIGASKGEWVGIGALSGE